jgi:hypothetical protein
MTGQTVINAAVKKLHAKYDVQSINSNPYVRWCDYNPNIDSDQPQEIAEVTINATITCMGAALPRTLYITIFEGDAL